MLDSGTSHATWSARYEQLRAGWFAGERTWGQALLARQGMTAWLKAWPAAERSEPVTRSAPIGAGADSSPPVTLGGELQRQLARELAHLILHHQQEVVA